jgi:hypothetical protein
MSNCDGVEAAGAGEPSFDPQVRQKIASVVLMFPQFRQGLITVQNE